MQFKNFEIHARPAISDAFCECGKRLEEVSDGWFSVGLFCEECENVYKLELRKVPSKKVSKEWIRCAKLDLELQRKQAAERRALVEEDRKRNR